MPPAFCAITIRTEPIEANGKGLDVTDLRMFATEASDQHSRELSAHRLGLHDGVRAACRALEARRHLPRIQDPFAELLVTAVGEPHSVALTKMRLNQHTGGVEQIRLSSLLEGRALHDRCFDSWVLAATSAGIRQVVIMLAGLDTRAYRLPWPRAVVIYEVNAPSILDLTGNLLSDPARDFKGCTLAAAGIAPNAVRRLVTTDLHGRWQSALTAAGFDPEIPTAWMVEKPTTFLPVTTQNCVFEGIIELSASGSRLLAEDQYPSSCGYSLIDTTPAAVRSADLPLPEHLADRTSPVQWLAEHGWLTKTIAVADVDTRYPRPPTPRQPPRDHGSSGTEELRALKHQLLSNKLLVQGELPHDYTMQLRLSPAPRTHGNSAHRYQVRPTGQ